MGTGSPLGRLDRLGAKRHDRFAFCSSAGHRRQATRKQGQILKHMGTDGLKCQGQRPGTVRGKEDTGHSPNRIVLCHRFLGKHIGGNAEPPAPGFCREGTEIGQGSAAEKDQHGPILHPCQRGGIKEMRAFGRDCGNDKDDAALGQNLVQRRRGNTLPAQEPVRKPRIEHAHICLKRGEQPKECAPQIPEPHKPDIASGQEFGRDVAIEAVTLLPCNEIPMCAVDVSGQGQSHSKADLGHGHGKDRSRGQNMDAAFETPFVVDVRQEVRFDVEDCPQPRRGIEPVAAHGLLADQDLGIRQVIGVDPVAVRRIHLDNIMVCKEGRPERSREDLVRRPWLWIEEDMHIAPKNDLQHETFFLAFSQGGHMTAAITKLSAGARPSIRDVARRAGVSPGCVSNVINGRRRQDDPIGRAVLQAIDEIGYRRNTMASNLRRSQSRIIGLVIPDFENPFFAELVAQLELCAERTNYRIVATSSREDSDVEMREIDELIGWRVAGVLLIPSFKSRASELITHTDTPFVLLDRALQDVEVDTVGVNNTEASAEAMSALIASGHRRILVAYLGDGIENVADRLEGVRRAVDASAGTVTVDYLATGDCIEGARASLAAFLEAHPEPDAVFCLFNTATLAAYGVMQQQGLAPGAKTTLIGFDDSAWMAHVHPPVAAIVQPVRDIAEAAWARLLARIEHSVPPQGMLRVPCRIEARGSFGNRLSPISDTGPSSVSNPKDAKRSV